MAPYTEDLTPSPKRVRPIDVQAVALQLKASLEKTREPIAAGDFHFANMEMKRLQAKQEDRKARARLLWTYKFLNGYGERFGRTLILLGALVLIFSFVYWGLYLICCGGVEQVVAAKTKPSLFARWVDSFIYTLQHVLPFKLQASELKAGSRLVSIITIFQTIIGTSLFTLFILALRSRFRR